MRVARAFAPASIGNVASGFDCLGLAIRPVEGEPWGDVVTVRAEGPPLTVEGPYAHHLPDVPTDNLVLRCAGLYAAELAARGHEARPAALTLHKGLPICSGLGSSAASVVAALAALDAWNGDVLSDALLRLAGEGEAMVSGAAHLDNVGPALLGGLQLCTSDGTCRSLPVPEGWRLCVVHPPLRVPTADARAVLPSRVPLDEAIQYWQTLATLVDALHRGESSRAAEAIRDRLIEPARAPLVPGFAEAKAAALDAGAAACSLSGSGPSVFAVCTEPSRAEAVLSALAAPFGPGVRQAVCHVDPHGAVVEEA